MAKTRSKTRKRKTKRKNPIRIDPANAGKMRKTAGAKKGRKIPVASLRKLKNSPNPVTRKRATFALNARKWAKPKKRR